MIFQPSITIIALIFFVTATESTSKYEGVSWNEQKKLWQIEFNFNAKKSKYYFDNELNAAQTRNRVYKKMRILPQNPEISVITNQQFSLRHGTSKYNGVCWNKKSKKWYAQIRTKGKPNYCGCFDNELDAAKRVNQICEKLGIPQKNSGIGTMVNTLYQSKQKRSQYKGIHWNKTNKKWCVHMTLKGEKQKYFGIFDDELNAAKKVNQICQEHGIPLKNPGIEMIPNQQWEGKQKTSQYKGVHWNTQKKKWYVQVRLKSGSIMYGGNFNDELDAAKRVNQLCEETGNTAKNPEISGLPNQQVVQKKEKPSHYKGVFWNKKIGKWYVLIHLTEEKQKFGGNFTNELDAAKKVNQLCQEFGMPMPNHGIKTNLKNYKTLIDYNAMHAEFGDLMKILDETNDSITSTIKKNLIATINYGEQIKITAINLHTTNGESALSIAAKHGFLNIVKFLISKGAEKEHFTNDHHTPLSLAVSQNHLKVVQVLFQDWISPNSHEPPYLHLSPLFNVKSREIAQLLVDNDAVTTGLYNDKNQSPLTVACQNGYLDVVEFFLDDGLDINHLDIDNKTPLFYAITNKHYNVVNLLISQGAKNEF